MALAVVPPLLVRSILLVTAPAGTVTVAMVEVEAVTTAGTVPKLIVGLRVVKFVRPVPVMTTVLPIDPLGGLKLVIIGLATTVKLAALDTVPPVVVRLILFVTAPAGTVTVAEVEVEAVTTAATVPKVTAGLAVVALVKLVPFITTEVPIAPLAGEKLVKVGLATTVKLVALVAVPPLVVTVTLPVIAAVGTVTVAVVRVAADTVAAMAPNFTVGFRVVALVKPVPAITMLAPIAPLLGVSPVMVGCGKTLKFAMLAVVPATVVTVIGPVLAPGGKMT